MAMLAPTIIIGDMNAAPTPADRAGQATPQDQAVRDTIEMLGLVDLTANLEGQPSHFPQQTDAAPSRIDVCYGDPTTIEAGSDPRGHLWVTWGVYLCAGKPPFTDIILSHLPDLT